MVIFSVSLFIATNPVFAAAGGNGNGNNGNGNGNGGPGNPALPEAPLAILLPLVGIVVIGLALFFISRRRSRMAMDVE
jgi:hypothetical protein